MTRTTLRFRAASMLLLVALVGAACGNSVTPVKGAEEELAKSAPETANNTLILPDDALLAQLHQYDSAALNNDEQIAKWQSVLGQ